LPDPERPSGQEPGSPAAEAAPPGEFLSRELESDCARFLENAKQLALRRAEALAAPAGRL
jgi:hypothetical protein